MKYWLLVGLAALLWGCGQSDDPTGSDFSQSGIAADAPLDITITQFPKSYFGRWGVSPSDCAMGESGGSGLISVQGSLVKFAESIATMRDGKRESLTSMSAYFDVVGEGREWETHTRYRLSKDRQKLTRQDFGSNEKQVYQRCRT